MDFDSDIVFMAQFTTCHVVNAGGLLEVQIQNGLVSKSTKCQIWSGVTSPPIGLGYTHQCNKVTISGVDYYHITGFDPIPILTQITIQFRGVTAAAAVTATPITIKSYFDAALRISAPTDATNVNDFYRQTINGIDITGPKKFPTKL